jgi:proteasome lid subunit RPN8/RPN11
MNDDAREWLLRRAMQAAPFEACGFVMEDGDVIEIRNVSLAPARHFKMDRNQLFEKLSDRTDFIAGVWHTHPGGTTHPSRTDLEGIKCGAIQRNWDYWIVTKDSVNLYVSQHYAPQDHVFWNKFREEVKT